ncbi:MAG: hypothetical protein AABZ60_22295 [Planctomycetota bacterium]
MKSKDNSYKLLSLGVSLLFLGSFPCFSQEPFALWLQNLQAERQTQNHSQLKTLWMQISQLSIPETSRRVLLEELAKTIEKCPPQTLEDVEFYFQSVSLIYPQEPIWDYLWASQLCRWKMISKVIQHIIQGNDKRNDSLFEPLAVQTYQSLALTDLAILNLEREEWAQAELRIQTVLNRESPPAKAKALLEQIPLQQEQKRKKLLQEFKQAVASRKFPAAILSIQQLGTFPLSIEEMKELFPVCLQSIEVFSPECSSKELDQWFELLQKIYPYEPIIEYLWVNILCGGGRYSESQFHMIRGNDSQAYSLWAEEEYRRYQSLALTSLATYNLEYVEWELANLRINAALKIDPKNARAYILLGQMAGIHKNWQAVYFYFEKAYALNPKMFFASHYMMLGKAFILQKEFEKALQLIQEGITRFPNFADFYVMQAELWTALGKPIDSYLSYQMAYFFSPANSEPLKTRIQILVNAGTRAKLNPELDISRFILAMEQAASQLLLDPAQSLQQLQICTQLYPKSHLVLELLQGMAIELSGEIDQAIELFKKQTEQFPYFLPSYVRLFKCYWKQKKWNTMLIWLNRALEIGDIDNIWLAQVYFFSLIDENHYHLKFRQIRDIHPLKRELFQAQYWNLDEVIAQLEDSELGKREQALLKLQELFKKTFGYHSQSSLEDMNKNIQAWKDWIPKVRPYLIYSHEYQGIWVDKNAQKQQVSAEVWQQFPAEKKQAWIQSTPAERKSWIDELQKVLDQSRPFLPNSLLSPYLVPNID